MNAFTRTIVITGLLLLCCLLTEQVPINGSSLLSFEDEWNYKVPTNEVPLLNESQRNLLLPFYSFVNDLKVEGIGENATNSTRHFPTSRDAKLAGDIIRTKVPCNVCNLGVGLLYAEVKSGVSMEEIKAKFVSICVSFKIESFSVCSGIFDTYGPEVVPVMELMTIGPPEVCKLIFGEICKSSDVASHEWTVDLPTIPKPNRTESTLPKVGMPVFKVLQISDTHYDLDYVEGAVTNCEEPLCCRTYSTLRSGEEPLPAGRWGSYEKCDAPKALLENMLQNIAFQHPDIDYILWTGDLPPHDIWNQTKQKNLKVIEDTIAMVVKAFPNTPIFPAVGNHESSPAGNFAPHWMTDPDHSVSWLYQKIGASWSGWLPKNTEETIHHGAFYSVLLRPGFRLISVNTNYCHSLSWWLLVNSTDPASELKWLIAELQKAESNSEKVHIIGHIAPGSSDCMKTWSSNFYNIVNRYEHTIKALFYGHSHADEFEVFYEATDFSSRATAVAYLAPSVTSFTNYNPAFRIYYVDGDHENTTREVLEHETWTFDLDTANLPGNEPNWFKSYSATDEFQLNSLRPNEWNNLIERMIQDDELFHRFYRNYYRHSPTAPPCDSKCKLQILCDLKSAKSHTKHQLCHELETAFQM
uniref:Sphingomyelin phosphodiesterase n=1 Tax=Dendroctonus ponderosae TaxID=77166 RepID=A0AAR5Q9V9_DENPD